MTRVVTAETELTDTPVCPWCGCSDPDWWELGDKIQDGNTFTVHCDNCDQPYDLHVQIDYHFTSSKRTSRMILADKVRDQAQRELHWRIVYYSSRTPEATEKGLIAANHLSCQAQAALDAYDALNPGEL
jgi:hypothetical protein